MIEKRLPPTGVELSHNSTGKQGGHAKSGAKPNSLSGPLQSSGPLTLDPDLAGVMTAWPALPDHVKFAIVTLAGFSSAQGILSTHKIQ